MDFAAIIEPTASYCYNSIKAKALPQPDISLTEHLEIEKIQKEKFPFDEK